MSVVSPVVQYCTLCGDSRRTRVVGPLGSVYSETEYSIESCAACGLEMTVPTPTAEELSHIYRDRYAYEAHALIVREKRVRARRNAERLVRHGQVRSAVEVGCMHGDLLEELNRRGILARGVEPSEAAVENCRARGLDVAQGTLEDFTREEGPPPDAVVMSHVLEHVLHPLQELERLAGRLTHGGVLLINVPNARARSRRLLGKAWGWWQVPVHVHHFDARSLSRLLEQSGFRVSSVEYFGADSLFWMLSVANVMGVKSRGGPLSTAQHTLIRAWSMAAGTLATLGDEELTVLAERS